MRITKVDGLPIDDTRKVESPDQCRPKFHNSVINLFAHWRSKGLPKIRTEISFLCCEQEKIIERDKNVLNGEVTPTYVPHAQLFQMLA